MSDKISLIEQDPSSLWRYIRPDQYSKPTEPVKETARRGIRRYDDRDIGLFTSREEVKGILRNVSERRRLSRLDLRN